MGYRFSRRIRICKGVHLNVSKSGVGISLGVRGASISTGPGGTVILRNSSGYPIHNETLVQKVMRSPEYKEMVRKARSVKNDLITKQNEDAIFFL